jgi:hypothetical protein
VQRAPGIPHALCFPGRKIHQRLGRNAPRGREVVSRIGATSLRAKRSNPFFMWQDGLLRFARNDGSIVACERAPHSQPSSPAKAGDPVFRGVSDRVEKPRRTGYSAFAEYDDLLWSSAATQVRLVIARSEATKQSNFLRCEMDCFASLAMTVGAAALPSRSLSSGAHSRDPLARNDGSN